MPPKPRQNWLPSCDLVEEGKRRWGIGGGVCGGIGGVISGSTDGSTGHEACGAITVSIQHAL